MSQIKHSISAHCFSFVWKSMISPDPDGEMPEEVTWQFGKHASPQVKASPWTLITLFNWVAFNLHPEWNGHGDGKLRASYPIPVRRTKIDYEILYHPICSLGYAVIPSGSWRMPPIFRKKNWSSYILRDRKGVSVVYLSTKERWTVVNGVPFYR